MKLHCTGYPSIILSSILLTRGPWVGLSIEKRRSWKEKCVNNPPSSLCRAKIQQCRKSLVSPTLLLHFSRQLARCKSCWRLVVVVAAARYPNWPNIPRSMVVHVYKGRKTRTGTNMCVFILCFFPLLWHCHACFVRSLDMSIQRPPLRVGGPRRWCWETRSWSSTAGRIIIT